MSSTPVIIFEKMKPDDWPFVEEIYRQGIATGHATFQKTMPVWEYWDKNHLSHSRIVARQVSTVTGWAAISRVSAREVYEGVAEVSVYVSENNRGKGLGQQLLENLVEASEANNIWTLQASIFLENISSLKIHERCGFRIVGRRERIGKMDGYWRDTVLMERRSKLIE